MNLSLNLLGKMQTNMKMEELEVLELLEEFQEVVEASAVDKKMKREFSLKKKFLLKKFSFSEIFLFLFVSLYILFQNGFNEIQLIITFIFICVVQRVFQFVFDAKLVSEWMENIQKL